MIPISQSEKVPVTIGTVKYFVKPICGDTEYEHNEIVTKYIGKKKDGTVTKKDEWETMDSIIDLILVGWEGNGQPFPSDGHPSKFLRSEVKMQLTNVANDINSLSGEEVKN
jgi:hypothetical protein